MYIGIISNMVAELWAIRCGFKLDIEMGCSNLHIESDSTEAIHMIMLLLNPHHPYLHIVQDVKHMLNSELCRQLAHTYREGNMVADCLAKIGTKQEQNMVTWSSLPPDVSLLLLADLQTQLELPI